MLIFKRGYGKKYGVVSIIAVEVSARGLVRQQAELASMQLNGFVGFLREMLASHEDVYILPRQYPLLHVR